jgi:hypothetical protein
VDSCFLQSFPSRLAPSRGDLALTITQKQKQQQDANEDAAAGNKRKKVTAAQLRVQKGIVYCQRSVSQAPLN